MTSESQKYATRKLHMFYEIFITLKDITQKIVQSLTGLVRCSLLAVALLCFNLLQFIKIVWCIRLHVSCSLVHEALIFVTYASRVIWCLVTYNTFYRWCDFRTAKAVCLGGKITFDDLQLHKLFQFWSTLLELIATLQSLRVIVTLY